LKSDLFTTIDLANGVRVMFTDCTNRYYGDYHRVSIEINLSFAAENYQNIYKFQTLERMGVSGDDVVAVQTHLVDSFRSGTMVYMTRDGFADKFLMVHKKRKSVLLPGMK